MKQKPAIGLLWNGKTKTLINNGDIMEFLIILVVLIAIFLTIVLLIAKNLQFPNIYIEPGNRREGRRGEIAATNVIKSVIREGDLLFTNVEVSFENKPAELDNVVINKFGVFIIEVKNYKGRLYGSEDDYEWIKYKADGYGNTFQKRVKNPIKQVKRQVYILAKHLDYYGSRVWVEGYALLMQGNSPVHNKYVLSSIDDIDRAIHTPGRNRLTKQQVDSIAKLIAA